MMRDIPLRIAFDMSDLGLVGSIGKLSVPSEGRSSEAGNAKFPELSSVSETVGVLFEGHSSGAINGKFPELSFVSETVGVLRKSSQVSRVTDPSRAVYACSLFV